MRGRGFPDPQIKTQRIRLSKYARNVTCGRNSELPEDVVVETIRVAKTNSGKILFTSSWIGATGANLTSLQHLRRIALSIKTVENNIRLINALRGITPENVESEDFAEQRSHNLQVLNDISVYNKQISPTDINPNKLSTTYQSRNISTDNINRFSYTMGSTLLESIAVCYDLIDDTKDKLDEKGVQVLTEVSNKFEKIATIGNQLGENLMSGTTKINHVASVVNDINNNSHAHKPNLTT